MELTNGVAGKAQLQVLDPGTNYEILENLGVEILKDEFKTPFFNEETMETNVEGVFLAGVICGGLKTNKWFIENSRDHSEKIISQITKT